MMKNRNIIIHSIKVGLVACILMNTLHNVVFAQGLQTSSTFQTSQNKTKKYKFDFKLSLQGNSFEDEKTDLKTIDTKLDLNALLYTSENIYFDLRPTLRASSGQLQTYDGADSVSNKLIVRQAVLATQYKHFESLFGIVDQSLIHTSLTVPAQSFPALQLGLLPYNEKAQRFKILAELALPVNSSMASNNKEKEETTLLSTIGLGYIYEVPNQLKFAVSTSYYEWSNPNSSMAYQSSLKGNFNIQKVSSSQYKFLNDFKGIESKLFFEKAFTGWVNPSLTLEHNQNTVVAGEDGQAYLVQAGNKVELVNNIDVSVSGLLLKMGSDSAISYFSSIQSETNRNAVGSEMRLSFNDYKLNLSARYLKSNLVYENPNQKAFDLVTFKMETTYDGF